MGREEEEEGLGINALTGEMASEARHMKIWTS